MANRNRTEVAAAIEALAAVVDLEELKEALNDFFAQSCVFRKDVSATDVASGAKTLIFTDIDYIAVTQSASSNYTLSGVQQGEVKYLRVIKSAAETVSFTGTIDATPDPAYVTAQTDVLYQITNKDGVNIYATLVSQLVGESSETVKGIIEKATTAEANVGTSNKNITADLLLPFTGGLNTTIISIGDWDMNSLNFVSVTHGLTLTDIRSINVIIRNDDNTFFHDMNVTSVAGVVSTGVCVSGISTTAVALSKPTGSFFDSTDFDSTPYNRGWIVIRSEP